jgi:TPR repeat protein
MVTNDSGSSNSLTTMNFTAESLGGRSEAGDAVAHCTHAIVLEEGDGIAMDKSPAVHYFKLSADQGDAGAQFNYGILLEKGDGTPMNKSHVAHYHKNLG